MSFIGITLIVIILHLATRVIFIKPIRTPLNFLVRFGSMSIHGSIVREPNTSQHQCDNTTIAMFFFLFLKNGTTFTWEALRSLSLYVIILIGSHVIVLSFRSTNIFTGRSIKVERKEEKTKKKKETKKKHEREKKIWKQFFSFQSRLKQKKKFQFQANSATIEQIDVDFFFVDTRQNVSKFQWYLAFLFRRHFLLQRKIHCHFVCALRPWATTKRRNY